MTTKIFIIADELFSYNFSFEIINRNTIASIEPRFRADIVIQIPDNLVVCYEGDVKNLFYRVLEENNQSLEYVKEQVYINRKSLMYIVRY